MDTFNDYTSFPLQELLNDDKFIALVNKRHSDASLLKEWDRILAENVTAGAVLREAANIIDLAAGSNRITADRSRQQEGWEKIAARLQGTDKVSSFSWWRIAALFVLIASVAGAAFLYVKNPGSTVKWQTAVEQFRVVNLPDQSIVTLGANSTLSYKGKWKENTIREVWLSGEAHFKISHLNRDSTRIKKGEKFIVHVGDEMEVEVLGTVFNVKRNSGKTIVELESGSVRIALKNNQEDYVWLKPGEKAELDSATHLLTRLKSAEQYFLSDSGEKTLELNNTSVKEIIQILETTYNKKIEVYDTSILYRRIDGTFPICREKDVWFILSSILDIDIEAKTDDLLVFKPK